MPPHRRAGAEWFKRQQDQARWRREDEARGKEDEARRKEQDEARRKEQERHSREALAAYEGRIRAWREAHPERELRWSDGFVPGVTPASRTPTGVSPVETCGSCNKGIDITGHCGCT